MPGFANTVELYESYDTTIGFQEVPDPGSNGTFALRGRWGMFSTIDSGTRKLPDNIPPFVKFYAFATGNGTLTNAAGTTVATLASGEVAECMSTGATTWVATIYTAGALEINTAADLPAADAGGYTTATNVETQLQELLARKASKFTTRAFVSEATVAAGDLTGASHVYWENTANGAIVINPREGTQLFSDAGAYVGMEYLLTIISNGDNTVTMSSGVEGVTITGTATIATNTTRTFAVTFTAADAVTFRSVNKGTIE